MKEKALMCMRKLDDMPIGINPPAVQRSSVRV